MKKFISIFIAMLSCMLVMTMTVSADKWVKTEKGYSYEYDNGTIAEQGWLKVGKDTYYIQKDGTRKTGWLKTSTSKYYLGKDGKMYKNRWLTLKNGTKYYLQSNGKAAINCTIKISDKSYKFDESGKLIVKTKENTVVYNKNKVKVTYNEFIPLEKGWQPPIISFDISNKSGSEQKIKISDFKINGVSIKDLLYTVDLSNNDFTDDSRVYIDNLRGENLESKKIETIESISFTVTVGKSKSEKITIYV